MIVSEYVDEVVSRTTRKVHVVEEEGAEITLWHGGRFLDRQGGGPLASCMREAARFMERFSVGPRSSLHVRVGIERSRSFRVLTREGKDRWGNPEYETSPARPCVRIGQRHVWDSHDGDIVHQASTVGFERTEWIGFHDEACDPGGQLGSYYAAAEPSVAAEDLWAGFGHGAAAITGIRREEGVPGHLDVRGDRIHHWAKVTVEGTCEVLSPPGTGQTELERYLEGVDLDVRHDRDALGKLPNRWSHYCGRQAAILSWRVAPLALPAPVTA